MSSKRISRRRLLQVSATAAGYYLTAGTTPAQQRTNDPLRKLNIALIAAGGRAEGNLGGVKNENIVALCDVDDRRARKAFNDYPSVPKYKDFRVMLEKQKDIEAVVVSTPDHTHAHASIMAMKMGKHCYCEKPLTHSVWEARQMKIVAQNAKVATQMGNQGTSNNELRIAAEVLRSGVIGDVREVHVWTNRPIWKQNINRPTDQLSVPAELDWDLWLGPAPHRPYHSAYVPFSWRGWWDFGTGALGDMGCHTMNLAFMGLKLGAPVTVEAELATPLHPESGPEGCTVTLEFPARENFPACKLFWYERRKPADALFQGEKPSGSGSLFIGSKGTLYSGNDYGAAYKLLPQKNFEGFRPPNPTIPRNEGGHHAEWIRACKGGPPAMSNFVDYSALLTETVLIGNVAMRVGKKFTWDTNKLQATDCPEAAQYIRREYRKGWELNP
jgi:predicted dehydrogenase